MNRVAAQLPATSEARNIARAVLVALLATLVYLNSLNGAFVSDDRALILDHPFTKRIGDWPAIFTAGHYAGSGGYRPVTTLSFAINYSLGGENSFGYHLINIALHALNSALVYFLLRRLFALEISAVVAALVFAVHPVHTEAVAWISGRAELLAAAFFLAAWLFHLRAAGSLTSRDRIFSGLFFLMAVLSKENAFILPFALFLSDLVMRKKIRYHSLGIYASYFIFAALAFGLRWSLYPRPLLRVAAHVPFIDNPLAHAGPLVRDLTAIGIQGDYLRLLIWPAKLCADYSFNTIPLITNFLSAKLLVSLLSFFFLIVLSIRSFRKQDRIWFGVAFFVLAIAPVANIAFPIGTIAAERLLYLPSIGFCAVIGLFFQSLSQRRIANTTLAIILLGMGARTLARNPIWHDELSLWSSTAQTAPQNFKAQSYLGAKLLHAGRTAEAIDAFAQARRIDPDAEDVSVNLAAALLQAGRSNEAMTVCREAITRNPQRAAFHLNLGLAYVSLGQLSDAIAELEEAVQLDPQNAGFHLNLGLALSRNGDRAGAMTHYRKATQLNPEYAEAWNALGAGLITAGQKTEARTALQTALQLRPNYPEATFNLRLAEQP